MLNPNPKMTMSRDGVFRKELRVNGVIMVEPQSDRMVAS